MTYLTYEDLAERFGVPEVTLRSWRHRGKLPEPDRMFGRSPAWLESTIEALEVRDGRLVADSAR